MNSMLTSDRVTHVKIGMTAALATSVVIMIGIYARPPGNVGGQPARIATQSMAAAVLDQQVMTNR
jgi:hypothetical protein